MRTQRVLISGCGYVGRALAEFLVRDGYEVFGLRRDPRGLPPGVHPVKADFTDPDSLQKALPGGIDYVFHTASPGVSASSTAGEREAAYRSAYALGPSNLASVLSARGESPRRVLLTSSTGVYAQTDGEWVDETSPAEATGPGRLILEGERIVTGGPLPGVALRLAGIYGPGRTGALDRARRYPLPGSADGRPVHEGYTNRIHRDDCAGALRHLMLLDHPEPLYVGADHEPTTLRETAAWLAEKYPEARRIDAAETGSGPRSPQRRTNKRCSNERLLGSGYSFTYPTFREGFAALL